MILESSPETHELHVYKRKRICDKFPILTNCNYRYYSDFWKYIKHKPEKFFSQKVLSDFLSYLDNLKQTDPEILAIILKQYEGSFSLAFRSLAEINALQIHDSKSRATSTSDQYNLMLFCNEDINPNYLKLIEASYSNLILPIAAYRRLKQNLGMDRFDVFNRVDELNKTEFKYISQYYNNTIRNGIAHGNIKFFDRELIYEDKNKKEQRTPRDIINLFDETVDICNGLALALRIFYIQNLEFIENYSINKPTQIVLEELQSEVDAPGWKIVGCISSETQANRRRQLVIFVKHDIYDPLKIDYYLLRSAVFAEKFYPSYERYFFSLDSNSLSSWASFYGKELEKHRLKEENIIENYKGVWENKMIFYRYNKLPKFLFKISTLLTILRTNLPLKLQEIKENRNELLITVRDTEIHRNGYYSISNAIVVVEPNSDKRIDELIRDNCSRIAYVTIKEARHRQGFYNLSKFLKVGHFHIKVFSRDYRVRRLENSGLMQDFLCTLAFSIMPQIKRTDIAGGISETIKNYRIVWNKRSDIRNFVQDAV